MLFWRVNLTYGVLIIVCGLVFIATWWLILKKVKSKKEALFYSFFNLLIILSGLTALLFIENLFLKISLAIFVIVSSFLYLNELFVGFFKEHFHKSERLWLFFRIFQIIIIFLAATSLYGFRDFLSIRLVWLLIILFVLAFILFHYNNWSAWKTSIGRTSFISLLALVVIQLFWAVSLLPLVYYLKGIIIAILY